MSRSEDMVVVKAFGDKLAKPKTKEVLSGPRALGHSRRHEGSDGAR